MNSKQRRQARKQKELVKLGRDTKRYIQAADGLVAAEKVRADEAVNRVKALMASKENLEAESKMTTTELRETIAGMRRAATEEQEAAAKELAEVSSAYNNTIAASDAALATALGNLNHVRDRLERVEAALAAAATQSFAKEKELAELRVQDVESAPLRRRLRRKEGELDAKNVHIQKLEALLAKNHISPLKEAEYEARSVDLDAAAVAVVLDPAELEPARGDFDMEAIESRPLPPMSADDVASAMDGR